MLAGPPPSLGPGLPGRTPLGYTGLRLARRTQEAGSGRAAPSPQRGCETAWGGAALRLPRVCVAAPTAQPWHPHPDPHPASDQAGVRVVPISIVGACLS